MSVSDLLAILKITKCLSRVLGYLINTNYIQQTQGVWINVNDPDLTEKGQL